MLVFSEYSRGPEGVEIKCLPDSIEVGVSTKNDFQGLFYVNSQLHDEKCAWHRDSNTNKSDIHDLTLKLPLRGCRIESSFSVGLVVYSDPNLLLARSTLKATSSKRVCGFNSTHSTLQKRIVSST